MAENRGVFRLRTLRTENVQGDGVPVTDVWSPPARIATADASYMVGGLMNNYDTSNTASDISSQTDKITYASSTTSRLPGSNLTNSMYGGVGMSSLLAMYSAGGPNVPGLNPLQSNVQKLTYATGSWALLPHAVSGLKCEPKESTQGVGDGVTVGYFFAGKNNQDGTSRNSYTQKYTFAYDLASRVPTGDLVYTTYGATAAGNQEKAVVTGGSQSGWSQFFTYVSKFTYSDDTMVQMPGINLSSSSPKYKGYGEAAAANTEYIWYAGGSQVSPQGGAIKGQTTVSRLTMAVDSIEYSLPSTQLTYPTFKHGGVDNGTNGYFAGGNSWNGPSPGGPYSSANKLTFSNGTMAATPGANLTQAKSLMQTAGPRQYSTPSPGPGGDPYRWVDNLDPKTLNVGYWSGGGGSPSQTSSTDQLDFNSNTRTALPSSTMPRQGMAYAGVLSDTTKVLVSGGEPSGGNNDFIKFTYATKTFSFLPGAYPGVKRTRNNDNNSIVQPSVGYIVAGQNDSGNVLISSTDKITFATDTATTVPGANYSHAANYIASWGDVNLAHGYAYGGNRDQPSSSNPAVSTINKLTYATETVSNIPANTGMSPGSFGHSSMSSSTHGYIMGGRYYPSSNEIPGDVYKFNFSTETRSTVPQPGPAYRNYYANATGNSTDGYSGGGQSTSYPQRYSTVRKLSFTTETFSVLGEVSSFSPGSGRSQSAAFSQGSNGKSIPTAPTPTPTPVTSPRAGTAPNFGVAGGGNRPGVGTYTLFDKLTYATETNSTLPGSDATIGTNSYTQRSVTSQTEGWSNSAGGTHLWKFVYSTSTQNPSPASHTTLNYADGFTFSNKTEGYFGGGANVGAPGPSYSGGPAQSLDKFTFSTSTASRMPDVAGSPSNYNWYFQTSNVGNQQVGYYSGGSSRSMGKYVYATSTSTMTNNKLTADTQKAAGAGNATNGYFIAGDRSTTDRIVYSTDTITALPGASYPSGDQTTGAGSHSSSDAGYIQSGRSPSAPNSPFNYHWSSTRKLTYSSETLSTLPASANVNMGRNDYSGMSARQNNNGDGLPAPNVL